MTTANVAPFELPEMWMELKDLELLIEQMGIKRVSARELAKAAGWKSHTYMQRILRGEVKTLKVDPALRIAHRLGVLPHRLFELRVSDEDAHPVREKVLA